MAYLNLTAEEARIAGAIFNRLFPADDEVPDAVDLGVLDFLDRALTGAYQEQLEAYRHGLPQIDAAAQALYEKNFTNCSKAQQDSLLSQLEQGQLAHFTTIPQQAFFAMLLKHMREGLFSDPLYGGNRNKLGWKYLKHPGVCFDYSAEEQLSDTPAEKDGQVWSIADYDFSKIASQHTESLAREIVRNRNKFSGQAVDVIIVGIGGVGAVIAPRLAKAGLKVVGLEAGSLRKPVHYLPDELGISFYGRAGLGTKFNQETPRWRLREDAPNHEAFLVMAAW